MIEPEVLKNGDFESFQEAINNIKSLKTEAQDYLGFATEPNARYDIRDDDENCKLVVIGNTGTTFTIIEHKSATDLFRCHRNRAMGCVKLRAS